MSCVEEPSLIVSSEAENQREARQLVLSFKSWYLTLSCFLCDAIAGRWRWTNNRTHAELLRPGLELHAAWAHDSFDGDGSGLFHSFINTWPTDAVYYNGGESVEETACTPATEPSTGYFSAAVPLLSAQQLTD